MNEAKALLKAERARATKELLLELMRNPVVQIVAGYLVIELLQNIGYTNETLQIKDALTGKVTVQPLRPIIPSQAGTVAEAGLLVAVAMQQPATMEIAKAMISAGADIGMKLIPSALTALK